MENQKSIIERWLNSFALKMVFLAFLGLLLLIPLQMVKEVIRERAAFAEQAKNEIAESWASAQTITGPVLNIPGTMVLSDGRVATETLHILPEKLSASATIKPERRYRGIYESVVYESLIDMTGYFTTTGSEGTAGFRYDWSQAYVSLGVSDNKGIQGSVILTLADITAEAEPGPVQTDIFKGGIWFPTGLSGVDPVNFRADFSLQLGLKGSARLFFSPTGKTTSISISSPWPSPSFQGKFLPADREITADGFTASWMVTHLNRSFPQAWAGSSFKPAEEAFGVDLILEVDHYKKAERTAKYGLLFILVTFFVLIIIEIRSSVKIHLFYYLLTAFALILFFSLLSALSEHIGFSPAYMVASVATIGLLTAFFRSLVDRRWVVVVISGLLSTLYIFIFILLALKDYAYLAGNIGLFALLAALMMVSSKYRLFSTRATEI